MRMFIIISALMLPFTLNAQTARDNQNARGAHAEGSAPKDQGGGRVHNETSSDREEGRGARGAIR
jgi:hypothetical protein